MLARVDFFYPLWHGLLDIDRTVAVYGPENRHRRGFARTDAAEHRRLFAAIVDAIHDRDVDLATLDYRDPTGRRIDTLLTAAEIQHLRDVAALLEILLPAGAAALCGWLLLTGWARYRRLSMPAPRALLFGALAGAGAATLAVVAVGPTRLFYALHRWLFPADHQWFFYYQDSLMTTLMRAPLLFGPIAISLAVLTLLVFFTLLTLGRWTIVGRR